jgi:hypothetical protein
MWLVRLVEPDFADDIVKTRIVAKGIDKPY